MATTIRRISLDETTNKAVITLTDERGRTATGTFYSDGSGDITDGAKWLLNDLGNRHGKRPVRTAIQQAVRLGEASL